MWIMSHRKSDTISDNVINELKRVGKPRTTLELARALGMSRKDVNPTLYGMESRGLIQKIQESPPRWQLSRGGVMQGVRGAHGRGTGRGRGRGGGGRGAPPTSVSPHGYQFPVNSQYRFPSSATSANIGFGRGRGVANPPALPTSMPTAAPNFPPISATNPSPPLRTRLQEALGKAVKPLTALELAKLLDFSSRSSVNPDLYAMEKEGVVIRQQSNPNSPPVWSLPGRNFRSTSQPSSSRNTTSSLARGIQIVERDGPSTGNQGSGRGLLQPNQGLQRQQSSEAEGMEIGEETGEGGGRIDLSHIPEDDIEQRLLAVLRLSGSLSKRSELDLSNSISNDNRQFSRSDIKPYLASLEGKGMVRKMEGMPVTWQLLSSELPPPPGIGNPFGAGGLSSSPKGTPQKVRYNNICQNLIF